jgi:alpha-tubulin suppressor-like RCC1 family protein
MLQRLLTVLLFALGSAVAGGASGARAATSGQAWAWGDNSDGELGNGTTARYTGVATPGQVRGLTGVTAMSGGSDFSLALKSDGTVWAWGNGGWGQLGQGAYTSSTLPVHISSLSSVTAIAAGDLHALALKSDGTVWAWGFNYYGQVGNGTNGNNILAPVRVSGLGGVIAVAAGHGADTSYALKSDGTVWAWGYDGLGQLGNGTSNESAHPLPVKVTNLTGVVGLDAGTDHALAVRSDGTVEAWGSNQYSQLGARTTATCSVYHYPCSTIPILVPNLGGVTAVAGGGSFSVALKSDATVWGWGDNGYGQLANGTVTSFGGVTTPTKSRLSSVRAIAAGSGHTLALRTDGTVWAAGSNAWGQLGNGTFTSSSTPVQARTASGVATIGAGVDHSLAVGP